MYAAVRQLIILKTAEPLGVIFRRAVVVKPRFADPEGVSAPSALFPMRTVRRNPDEVADVRPAETVLQPVQHRLGTLKGTGGFKRRMNDASFHMLQRHGFRHGDLDILEAVIVETRCPNFVAVSAQNVVVCLKFPLGENRDPFLIDIAIFRQIFNTSRYQALQNALKDAAAFLARHGCDDWRLPLSSRLSEQPPGGEVIMFGSAAEYAGQYADGRLLFVSPPGYFTLPERTEKLFLPRFRREFSLEAQAKEREIPVVRY